MQELAGITTIGFILFAAYAAADLIVTHSTLPKLWQQFHDWVIRKGWL